MSSLVIAETSDSGELSGGTLSAISAARQLRCSGDDEITVLVASSSCSPASASAAAVAGVTCVLTAEHAAYAHSGAENMSRLVASLTQPTGTTTPSFSHIVAPASNGTKNFLPRVAALLDVAAFTDVLAIVDRDTFERPTYAGNAIARVRSQDPVKVLTVRTTAFDPAAGDDNANAATISAAELPAEPDAGQAVFVRQTVSSSDRPDLVSARVVVAGGRGMKNGENFALLETLADKLGGGAVGASRAAVDAGYVPNELQVGQTGKVVAPELYVAVGISGAIQHLAGMKDSKTIVCINKDEEAPIFQVADYGLVADLFQAVPELTQKL